MAARHQQIHIACSNLALIQAQSIIVSLFAAIAAIIAYGIETGKVNNCTNEVKPHKGAVRISQVVN